MRMNLDCIKDIIVSIANSLEPDTNGKVSPIIPAQLAQSALSQYPQNEVMYWINQLMAENIIVAGKRYIRDPLPQIKDLSMLGYTFVDTVSSPSMWEKVKPVLLSVATASIPTLLQRAIEIGVSYLG